MDDQRMIVDWCMPGMAADHSRGRQDLLAISYKSIRRFPARAEDARMLAARRRKRMFEMTKI